LRNLIFAQQLRETRDLRMSEKKVVGRNVVIALGIICVILAVGLVGAVANYTSIISGKDNTVTAKDSQIADKDDTISSLNSQIASQDSQISSLNSQASSLQNQVNDLNAIANLAKSTVWVNDETVSQPAGSYSYWIRSASYAGYVVVVVHSSTTSGTGVRVIYSSHGVSYDNLLGVGSGGTAVFPILPSLNIEIRVGNSNWFDGATETVTITYHY